MESGVGISDDWVDHFGDDEDSVDRPTLEPTRPSADRRENAENAENADVDCPDELIEVDSRADVFPIRDGLGRGTPPRLTCAVDSDQLTLKTIELVSIETARNLCKLEPGLLSAKDETILKDLTGRTVRPVHFGGVRYTQVEQTYKMSWDPDSIGQLLPGEGSLTRLSREVRDPMCAHGYATVELVNAVPTALLDVYQLVGVAVGRRMSDVVTKHSECLDLVVSQLGDPKCDAQAQLVDVYNGLEPPVEWLTELQRELGACTLEFVRAIGGIPEWADFHRIVEAVAKRGEGNLVGRLAAAFSAYRVQQWGLQMIQMLESRGLTPLTHELGATRVLLDDRAASQGQAIVDDINQAMREFDCQWITWRFAPIKVATAVLGACIVTTSGAVEETHPDRKVMSDLDAAEHFLELNRHRIVASNETLYLRDTRTMRYVPCSRAGHAMLTSEIQDMRYYTVRKSRDGDRTVPYSADYAKAERICKSVIAKAMRHHSVADFPQLVHDSTFQKLCFWDGYWCFQSSTFHPWDDDNINHVHPVAGPECNFPRHVPDDDVQRVFDTVFGNCFVPPGAAVDSVEAREGLDRASELVCLISRAIAGHYSDKLWVLLMGPRNCGKGTQMAMCQAALGDLYGEVNSQVLLAGAAIESDPHKLQWMAMYDFCRLLCTSEFKEGAKLASDIVKKFMSGGDRFQLRENHRSVRYFVARFVLLAMCNEIPKFDNHDVTETMRFFDYKVKFCTQQELESNPSNFYYRLGDSSVKQEYRQERWVQAFLVLLMRSYRPTVPQCEACRQDLLVVTHQDETGMLENIVLHQMLEVDEDHEEWKLTNSEIREAMKRVLTGRPEFKNVSLNKVTQILRMKSAAQGCTVAPGKKGWKYVRLRGQAVPVEQAVEQPVSNQLAN